jgi:hypothetical protein
MKQIVKKKNENEVERESGQSSGHSVSQLSSPNERAGPAG